MTKEQALKELEYASTVRGLTHDAQIYFKKLIQKDQQQLPQDVEEELEWIGNLFVRDDLHYPIQYRRLKYYPKANGILNNIKQYITSLKTEQTLAEVQLPQGVEEAIRTLKLIPVNPSYYSKWKKQIEHLELYNTSLKTEPTVAEVQLPQDVGAIFNRANVDEDKIVSLHHDDWFAIEQYVTSQQSKIDKVCEIVEKRLFRDYISDIEITYLKEVLDDE